MKFTEDKEETSLRKKMENDSINLPNIEDNEENDSKETDKENPESEREYSEHLKV